MSKKSSNQIMVRISPYHLDRLKLAAKAEEQAVAEWIRTSIRYALKHTVTRNPSPKGQSVAIGLVLPPLMLAEVTKAAAVYGIPRNEWIRRATQDRLECFQI